MVLGHLTLAKVSKFEHIFIPTLLRPYLLTKHCKDLSVAAIHVPVVVLP